METNRIEAIRSELSELLQKQAAVLEAKTFVEPPTPNFLNMRLGRKSFRSYAISLRSLPPHSHKLRRLSLVGESSANSILRGPLAHSHQFCRLQAPRVCRIGGTGSA